MQNVTILGMTLHDRSVEESMIEAGRFLRNGALDVIALVNTDVLMQAVRDSGVRELIVSAGMTEWLDQEILDTAGVRSESRKNEVSERTFIQRQLQSMVAIDGEIAIAGDTEASIAELRSELEAAEPRLRLIHDEILESDDGGIPEAAINAINEHAPAMVISRMDFGRLHDWLEKSRSMVNVGIWLAIPEGVTLAADKEKGIFKRLRRSLRITAFRHRAGKTMEG